MRKSWVAWTWLILGIFLVVRIGSNLVRLSKAGGRLTAQEEKLALVKKENQELKDKLAEVQTPEFLEREAREKLGMGREGEVVVIVPPEELNTIKSPTAANTTPGGEEPNWVKWRKLYLRW